MPFNNFERPHLSYFSNSSKMIKSVEGSEGPHEKMGKYGSEVRTPQVGESSLEPCQPLLPKSEMPKKKTTWKDLEILAAMVEQPEDHTGKDLAHNSFALHNDSIFSDQSPTKAAQDVVKETQTTLNTHSDSLYQCHIAAGYECSHQHSFEPGVPHNRHICKHCDSQQQSSPRFKARKPLYPPKFKLSDLKIYSVKLNYRSSYEQRINDLKPLFFVEPEPESPKFGFPKTMPEPIYGEIGFIQRVENIVAVQPDQQEGGTQTIECRPPTPPCETEEDVRNKTIKDWSKTPIYSELMEGLHETKALFSRLPKESLSQLGSCSNSRPQHPKGTGIITSPTRSVQSSKLTVQERVQAALSACLSETEVQYLLNLLKKEGTIPYKQQIALFDKAMNTFEVLMHKLGQLQAFEFIRDLYYVHKQTKLRKTVIKTLIRCQLAYDTIQRCKLIFKMQKKVDQLFKVVMLDSSVMGFSAEEKESQIAFFCLLSSRLFSQISKFLDECYSLTQLEAPQQNKKGSGVFLFNGQDLFKQVRAKIEKVREVYGAEYSDRIPQVDSKGKLFN